MGQDLGGSRYDWGSSVQQISDGAYIVAGWTDSFGTGEMDFHLCLIKTTSSGNEIWCRSFGVVSTDYFDIQQTLDGGYIVAGTACCSGAGAWDVYLLKIDQFANTPLPR